MEDWKERKEGKDGRMDDWKSLSSSEAKGWEYGFAFVTLSFVIYFVGTFRKISRKRESSRAKGG